MCGDWPVQAADTCDYGGHIAATDVGIPAENGSHMGCLELSGNLGEDSGGIHSQDRIITVIQPPTQARHRATINQSRYHKVGAVRGLDCGEWAGVVACDAGR